MPSAPHARIKEVFLTIIELPAAERAAALDRQCAGDEALRAEVESLLAFHRDDSLLGQRRSAEAAAASGDALPAPQLAVGQKVGSFRVGKPLGQGGMGTVYEAMHEYIERKAAIKVLHPHMAQNQQYKDRFLNESASKNPRRTIVHSDASGTAWENFNEPPGGHMRLESRRPWGSSSRW